MKYLFFGECRKPDHMWLFLVHVTGADRYIIPSIPYIRVRAGYGDHYPMSWANYDDLSLMTLKRGRAELKEQEASGNIYTLRWPFCILTFYRLSLQACS